MMQPQTEIPQAGSLGCPQQLVVNGLSLQQRVHSETLVRQIQYNMGSHNPIDAWSHSYAQVADTFDLGSFYCNESRDFEAQIQQLP